MKRYGIEQFGGPEVFKAIEAPTPIPKPNQAQVQVLAVGLNPYDASLRRGEQADSRPLTFPIIPGTDLVGRITAIGEAVTDLAVGDIVANYRPIGAYSQVVTASAAKLIRLPAGCDPLQAAILPQVAVVAATLLDQLAVPAGATLGIVGASGGVGATLTQLAEHAGLHVIAVASAHNQDYLATLEPAAHYAYDAAPAQAADAVVNAVAGAGQLEVTRRLAKPGAPVVSTNAAPNTQPLAKFVPFRAAMTAAFAAQVRLPIIGEFSLSTDGVQAGHELLETHHAPGKIVLKA